MSSNRIVLTDGVRRTFDLVSASSCPASLLVGDSGAGKSIASFAVMQQWIAEGRIAIRLDESNVSQHDSFQSALTSHLRSLAPALSQDCGHELLEVISRESDRCLVVIDDLNRCANPTLELRKSLAWSRGLCKAVDDGNQAKLASNDGVTLLIPTWFRHADFSRTRFEESPSAQRIELATLSDEDVVAIVQSHSERDVSEHDALAIGEHFNRDPILIGLWGRKLSRDTDALLTSESKLFEDFVSDAIKDVTSDALDLHEVREAFDSIARQVLRSEERCLLLQEVADTNGQRLIDHLRPVLTAGAICRVNNHGSAPRLEFRHDRVLHHLFRRPVADAVAELPDSTRIVSDPYLADLVAEVIVSGEDEDSLAIIRDVAPLALFHVLVRLTSTASSFAKAAIKTSNEWLRNVISNNDMPEIVWAATGVALQAPTDAVEAATRDLPSHHRVGLLRLACGDARGSLQIFGTRGDTWGIHPAYNDPFREMIVQRACETHRIGLVEGVAALAHEELSQQGGPDNANLIRLLIFCGYLGDERLSSVIREIWTATRDAGLIGSAFWAASRCAETDTAVFSIILDAYLALPNEPGEYGRSVRGAVTQNLRFSNHLSGADAAISFLVEQMSDRPETRFDIGIILRDVDDPRVVAGLSIAIAKRELELAGTGYFLTWTSDIRRDWDTEFRSRNFPDGLSLESRDALHDSWAACDDEELKPYLLANWLASVSSVAELQRLSQSDFDSEPLVIKRAKLGDQSACHSMCEVAEGKSYWLEYATRCWSEDCNEILVTRIEELVETLRNQHEERDSNEAYAVAHTLRDLPLDVSKPLFLEHWDVFKSSRILLHTALYTTDRDLVARATEEILLELDVEASTPRVETETAARLGRNSIVDMITMNFGFMTAGRSQLLTERHLEVLAPFVKHLAAHDLRQIAEWTLKNNMESHFSSVIEPEIRRRVATIDAAEDDDNATILIRFLEDHAPSESDLLSSLNALEDADSDSLMHSTQFWVRQAQERGESRDRLSPLLRSWCEENPSVSRLQIALAIIKELGTRSDLKWLREIGSSPDSESFEATAFAVRLRGLN